jgi:hypothetical protein
MKTRRGFFTALLGAVTAPMLLAKSGVAKALGKEKTGAEGGPYLTGSMGTHLGFDWFQSPQDKWVYSTNPLQYAALLNPEGLNMWPEPPVYPVHFQPWPWELLDFRNERTVTIQNQDGTIHVETINQGA